MARLARFGLCGLLLTVLALGCSKGDSANSTDGEQQNAPAANETSETSPAAAAREFMEAIRTGDDAKVTALLSSQAREQIGKMGFNLGPKGSDTAKYEVGEVELLPPDGARVASVWTDLDDTGKPRSDQIVWMLRKESEGWRVAGMAAEVFPGEPPLLLNFEDMEETMRKYQQLALEIERRAMAERQRVTGAVRTAQTPEAGESTPETR